MRPVAVALLPLLLAAPAFAAPSEDWSAKIRTDGLAKTEAALAGLADPTPDDKFALSGVHFLRGIEQGLQLRWSVGATGELAPVPLLRLPLPPNPAPEPYRATLVSEIFKGVLSEMDLSAAILDTIGDDAEVGLAIRFDDLWFDIDGNGSRGDGEGLMPLATAALMNPWDVPDPAAPAPVVRFDTADAAWLSAYAQLISAVAEFTLAYDPAKATANVLAANDDKRARLGATPTTVDMLIGSNGEIDKVMIAILALRQVPDDDRTRAAKSHLLAMIADNRRFWNRVAREKDNQAEWIPNDRQTGAFGVILPPNTGATWMRVLADLQAMLEGKLLVPHWSLPEGSGIDISAFLDKPAPLDVLGWLHGIDALPYARKGPTITAQNWAAFGNIVGGDSLLYALYLN